MPNEPERECSVIEVNPTAECKGCDEELILPRVFEGQVVLCPTCGARGTIIVDPLPQPPPVGEMRMGWAPLIVEWDTGEETTDRYAADQIREELRAKGVDVDDEE